MLLRRYKSNLIKERDITMSENVETKYECSIEHFVNDEYSICREERQYAVLLYNILRKYHSAEERRLKNCVSEIFKACRIPPDADIMHVFYEATFMRDFFERNRRLKLSKNPSEKLLNTTFSPDNQGDDRFNLKSEESFNVKLVEYVTKKRISCTNNDVIEVNLGHNAIPDGYGELKKEEMADIQQMMNAKPDIAIIYKEKETKKLLFLECKFESGESSYKDGVKQSHIQWKIADFLCNSYLKEEGIDISERMEDEKSCIVRFVRIEPKKPNEIQINELIKLNNKIFE